MEGVLAVLQADIKDSELKLDKLRDQFAKKVEARHKDDMKDMKSIYEEKKAIDELAQIKQKINDLQAKLNFNQDVFMLDVCTAALLLLDMPEAVDYMHDVENFDEDDFCCNESNVVNT